MEKLLDKINKDIKTAMKEKDASKLSVLRMALASLKNKKIELKQDDFLSNKQVISVIQSEVKKRKDSIESFIAGNREDLADKEKLEIKILEKYLPEQISNKEIEKTIQEIIGKNKNNINFGQVMSQAMSILKDKADGNQVSIVVKKILNN